MEVVVLAGGFGTRLQSVVSDRSKVMALVNNKPFLKYILDHFLNYNPSKFVLSVGYKYQSIKDYFGDEYQGIPVIYSIESQPLGTGGAIKLALKLCDQEYVIVTNGDTLFKINPNRLPEAALTIASLRVEDNQRYGGLVVESGKLKKISHDDNNIRVINGGIYKIKKNIFELMTMPDVFSFEKDFLPNILDKTDVLIQEFTDYFIDIGVPSDYDKAIKELK